MHVHGDATWLSSSWVHLRKYCFSPKHALIILVLSVYTHLLFSRHMSTFCWGRGWGRGLFEILLHCYRCTFICIYTESLRIRTKRSSNARNSGGSVGNNSSKTGQRNFFNGWTFSDRLCDLVRIFKIYIMASQTTSVYNAASAFTSFFPGTLLQTLSQSQSSLLSETFDPELPSNGCTT